MSFMDSINALPPQFEIPEMSECYEKLNNYEILELNQDSKICVIYFAGNGIYQSADPEDFIDKISINNRFEWKKNVITSARKAIFMRDIHKQWYFNGVNARINSIDEIYKFLLGETQGLEVICIGVSSGGYAATLFGCLLNASHVFNFSGQFCLLKHLNAEDPENFMILNRQNDSEFTKFSNLKELIKDKKTIPIFYFFPGKCDMDIRQFELVKHLPNIHSFSFFSSRHGSTCYAISFLDLFKMNKEKLIELSEKYSGKQINKLLFSCDVSGVVKTANYLIGRMLKRMKLGKSLASKVS